MLIAVDGFEASANNRVGVGRFEVEMLKHFAQIDKNNSYRIYTPRSPKSDLPRESKQWKYRVPLFRRLWSQVSLPLYLQLDRPHPHVFYSPIHYAPRYISVPLVLGIMDLSFLYFPDMFKKQDLYKLKNWTAYSVKKAQRIITISNATKNDILNQYSVPDNRVEVVYPGISQMSVKNENMKVSIRQLKAKYHIQNDYLLYVGTLQPRKNIVRLIEAFHMIHNMKHETWNKLQLVIVGKKGWLFDTIFSKVKELELSDSVVFTGFIPDDELGILYRESICFCLVSLYEGFGFPVLEAMQEGTPVVASNISSLPELVGDAGILVNPEDVTAIAHGIVKVLKMEPEERAHLISIGKQQAAKFTWEKTAKETLKVLEHVGNKMTN